MNLNTPEFYDDYWGSAACNAYLRDKQLDEIAMYIVERIGPDTRNVIDLGGGISRIARFAKQAGHYPLVVDFSQAAVNAMKMQGIDARVYDLTRWKSRKLTEDADVVVCTEVLEHIEAPENIVKMAAAHATRAFFTVPNDCMGPEECATHLRTYDSGSLRKLLSRHWQSVYIRPMYRWLVAEVAAPCR